MSVLSSIALGRQRSVKRAVICLASLARRDMPRRHQAICRSASIRSDLIALLKDVVEVLGSKSRVRGGTSPLSPRRANGKCFTLLCLAHGIASDSPATIPIARSISVSCLRFVAAGQQQITDWPTLRNKRGIPVPNLCAAPKRLPDTVCNRRSARTAKVDALDDPTSPAGRAGRRAIAGNGLARLHPCSAEFRTLVTVFIFVYKRTIVKPIGPL